MMGWKVVVRSITLMATVCSLAGVTISVASAQGPTTHVNVTPSNLSFGVPGTVTGAVSAPQTVTISVTSGTATINGISITFPTIPNGDGTTTLSTHDFTETDTCGINPSVPSAQTISAPGSCNVSVTFKATQSPGVLESAILSVSVSGFDDFHVALTGALGAIKLFDAVNVANSDTSTNQQNLYKIGSNTLNLSCPVSSPPATLSSTPDGIGNVVVDNYVTLSVNNSPFPTQNQPSGNVCSGGADDGSGIPDCFTDTYRTQVFNNIGRDPDDFQATWGVAPIDVSSAFAGQGTTPTATFSVLDQGTVYTSTSLFLATSCSLTNANTGSETGNPVSQQPSQVLTFDSVLDHLNQYSFDYSFVNPNSITNFNSTPTVTNNPISPNSPIFLLASPAAETPTNFPGLVSGTPFQGTACIPVASLNGSCALITQVCAPNAGGAASGAQCPQTQTGENFLFTSTFDPPASVDVSQLAPGFGILEFNDEGGCPLEGTIEQNLPCPQNGLVSFTGPGEIRSGTGKAASNSSYVVVQGITQPSTTVSVTPFFPTGPTSGWTNGNPSATFTGVPGATSPKFAPVNFIEWGINPTANGLPPTFPIPVVSDNKQANPTACQPTYPDTVSPLPTVSTGPVALGTFADGSSNLLHYSTTDCADTHELKFSFDGTKWATSFKTLTLMSDTAPPTVTLTTPPQSGGSYTANQKVKASYGCSDTESGVASCAGPVANGANIDTTPNGTSTTKTFTVNSKDNVGNNATPAIASYTVTCHYAAVTVSPGSVKRGAFINVTASVADCMPASQNVKVQFTLSGPLGKNCGNSSTVMFTTPQFTIRSGTSSSITFPFPIAKTACTGPYTVTTTTFQGATSIDSVTSTFTVTN